MQKEYLNFMETKGVLGLTAPALIRAVYRNRIPYLFVGGNLVFCVEELHEYLKAEHQRRTNTLRQKAGLGSQSAHRRDRKDQVHES